MASRVEGVSISLLEAMASGCVPVITRTRSGAAQAITDNVNGKLVDWESDSSSSLSSRGAGGSPAPSSESRGTGVSPVQPDLARLGSLLADGVCSVVAQGLAKFSAAARNTIRDHFTHEAHVASVMTIVDEIAAEEPRTWPASRPCAFTTGVRASTVPLASGTVPADAAARFHSTLSALKGRRVLIHGTGRHTLELQHALAHFTAAPNSTIIAFTDDDPTRHGSTILGLPILSPLTAHASGATDVVISSFINQNDIWQRRSIYESRGLTVHRLYPEAA
jgi:hypothetical protein